MVARHRGDTDLVAMLEGRGAEPGSLRRAELSAAARQGDLARVERLLAEGCDPAAPTPEGCAAPGAGGRAAGSLRRSPLVDAGADVDLANPQGATPADLAASAGFGDVARFLRSSGR